LAGLLKKRVKNGDVRCTYSAQYTLHLNLKKQNKTSALPSSCRDTRFQLFFATTVCIRYSLPCRFPKPYISCRDTLFGDLLCRDSAFPLFRRRAFPSS
jgi:hypothetical protein